MRISFHMKLGVLIIAVFGLLAAGLFVYRPLRYRWLRSQLLSDDAAVRAAAVETLAAESGRAFSYIQRWLKSGDERLVAGSCRLLERLEGNRWKEALPDLENILDGPFSKSTDAAARLLKARGYGWSWKTESSGFGSNTEREHIIWSAFKDIKVSKIQKRNIFCFLARHEEKNGRRLKAIDLLSGSEDRRRIVPVMLEVLENDADFYVRRWAAWALGRLKDPEMVDPLLALLNHNEDSQVISQALESLVNIGDRRVIPIFIGILEDRKRDNYSFLAVLMPGALAKLGDPVAVEPLIRVLEGWADRDVEDAEYVARKAADALGTLKDARATGPLVKVLEKTGDEELIKSSGWTLNALDPRRAVGSLTAVLERTPDEGITGEIIEMLADNPQPGALEPIIRVALEGPLAKTGSEPDDESEEEDEAGEMDEDDRYHAIKWGEIREAAIKLLGRTGDLRAVEPLIEIFENESNGFLREAAANELAKLGDLRAVEPLVRSFEGKIYSPTIARVATALGRLGDVRGTPPLVKILEKIIPKEPYDDDGIPDWVVRQTVFALGKIRDPRAVDVLAKALEADEAWEIAVCTAEALGRIGDPRAVKPLSVMLENNENFEARVAAAKALGEIGVPGAVAPLAAALQNDPNADVRVAAAEALGKTHDVRAIEFLSTAAANDNDSDVQEYLIKALRNVGGSGAADELLKLFENNLDYDSRAMVARMLGDMGETRAVPFLISSLNNSEMRYPAALALGRIGDARAVPALIALLSNDSDSRKTRFDPILEPQSEEMDYETLGAAVEALGLIGDARATEILSEVIIRDIDIDWPSLSFKAAKALGSLRNTDALEPLLEMLNGNNVEARYCASSALGYLGDPRAFEPLMNALQNDCDSDVRAGAAQSLGFIGDSRAVEALVHGMKNDKEKFTRGICGYALGFIGNKSAVEPLIDSLPRNTGEKVTLHLAYALGRIGVRRAIEPLCKALMSDTDQSAKIWITTVLGGLGDPGAAPALINAMQNDSNIYVRIYAAAALGLMMNDDIEKELRSMRARGVRLAALPLAWHFGGDDIRTAMSLLWPEPEDFGPVGFPMWALGDKAPPSPPPFDPPEEEDQSVSISLSLSDYSDEGLCLIKLLDRMRARWGCRAALIEVMCDFPKEHDKVDPLMRGVVERLPEEFPGFDFMLKGAERMRRGFEIRKKLAATAPRLAWDAGKRKYYLKPEKKQGRE